MCLIIYLSYVVSKFLAGNSVTMGTSKYMRIIDRVPLGKDRYLLIVKVGKKTFFLGVTDQGVNSIGDINVDDLIEQELPPPMMSQGIESFKQLLQKKMNPNFKDVDAQSDKDTQNTD